MTKMKFIVLLFVCIIQFSEQKPIAPETTTSSSAANIETSTVTESSVTIKPEDEAKPVSSTEKVIKNSSVAIHDTPTEIKLPVDLSSDDILLDPSLILARAERSVGDLGTLQVSGPIGDSLDIDRFEDDIPTFYFVRFVRMPRSAVSPKLVPEKIEGFRMPEQPDKTLRRFSRSAVDDEAQDLHGEEDGFIIRPLFKYRREQLKKSSRRGYRNRDTYSYYNPRYPVFPGK